MMLMDAKKKVTVLPSTLRKTHTFCLTKQQQQQKTAKSQLNLTILNITVRWKTHKNKQIKQKQLSQRGDLHVLADKKCQYKPYCVQLIES